MRSGGPSKTPIRQGAGERAWRRKWCGVANALPSARGHRQLRKCLAEHARSMSLGIAPCRATTWPRCAAPANIARRCRRYTPAARARLRNRQVWSAWPAPQMRSIFDVREVGLQHVRPRFVTGIGGEPTEAQDRAVWRQRALQFTENADAGTPAPITGSAHKTRGIGNSNVAAVVAAIDMGRQAPPSGSSRSPT